MVNLSAIGSSIMYILAGAYSDSRGNGKWGRRRPLAIGGVISGACMILVAFQTSYIMVFLLDVVLISIFANMVNASKNTVIPDIFPIEERGSINGKLFIADLVGTVLILVISMWAILQFHVLKQNIGGQNIDLKTRNRHLVIIISAGLITIIGSLTFFILLREPEIDFVPVHFKTALKNMFNLEEMKKHAKFVKFLIILVLLNIYRYMFFPYLIIFITNFAVNFYIIISILTAFCLGYLVASLKYGSWLNKNPRKKMTIIAVFISAIGFPIVSIFGDLSNLTLIGLIILSIAIFVTSFGFMSLEISQQTWSQDLLPKEERGKFSGILNLINTVSQIPGAFLGAWIYETYVFSGSFLGREL
ncbi:MAG: MFS transporter [Candidatus Lokiarchaeota archaeon]|nr:MFS transporter [Candidatus Lokiarchaeota archaeon]MBD3343318.1 MFS transporter [Candidatus Lokiarchaeota archaeon]